MLSKAERFQKFLDALRDARCASSADEAVELLANTLNASEDQWSGIPFNPASWASDGRMYPPQADSVRAVEGRPDLRRYRSRAHNTFIAENGAIEIHGVARSSVIFQKAGCDGRGVW